MTTDIDTIMAEMRAGLEGATPGPWEWDDNICDYDPEQEAPWLINEADAIVLSGQIKCLNEANARHIAACSPDRIAALLAEVERLRAQLAEATEEVERAERAFELLALADDAQRNGVTPSVRAQDLRAFLAKVEGCSGE